MVWTNEQMMACLYSKGEVQNHRAWLAHGRIGMLELVCINMSLIRDRDELVYEQGAC